MCHKFNPQGPGLKVLALRVVCPKSQGPILGSWVPGSHLPWSWVPCPGSQVLRPQGQGLGSQVPGSQVSGLDFCSTFLPVLYCIRYLASIFCFCHRQAHWIPMFFRYTPYLHWLIFLEEWNFFFSISISPNFKNCSTISLQELGKNYFFNRRKK